MAKKLSKPDLFEALGYKPHPGQLLVHRSTAPRRVLACGVRWGKSTCAVMEAAAALLQPREECLGWTVAPTLDLARLVFERTAALLMKKFKHRVKHYSQREQRIVVVNFGGGLSVLEGKTADHPTSLLGESLDFLIVDEAARMRQNVWSEHLSQRLLDRRGWALLISTPRGRDWFWRQFRRGQKGRDKDYESWCAPSWTNPYVSRELIEGERGRLAGSVFEEQYAAQFIGEELEPCDVCRGPSATTSGVVVVHSTEPLPRCPECGLAVDASGRSVVRRIANGRPSLMVIHLDDRADGSRASIQIAAAKGAARGVQMSGAVDADSPRLPAADLQARAN